jgi:GMP synthase-like glutamine amidotransferase
VFGICFGAQALAAASGGSVARAPAPEIGWCDVISDVDAIQGRWFQWHQDAFRIGPTATLLAHSPVGQQAFRVGRSVGVQFHPEVSTDLLTCWLEDDGGADMVAQGVDPSAVLAATRAQDLMTMASRTLGLIDWFLEEVAGS